MTTAPEPKRGDTDKRPNARFREFIAANIDPDYLTWAGDVSGKYDASMLNEAARLAALVPEQDIHLFFTLAMDLHRC